MATTINTTQSLRNSLFETMQGLANGSVDPKMARAQARIASQIIRTTRTEIQMEALNLKHARSVPGGSLIVLPSIKM